MARLKKLFDEEISKRKDKILYKEAECNVGYPTGLLSLDYKNGSRIVSEFDDGRVIEYESIGLVDGRYCLFIGKPGTGKTTMAVQAACKIAEAFDESIILHDDLERATTRSRIRQVSGWSARMIEDKYSIRDAGITSETFYQRLMTHAQIKIENYKEFSYDTGYIDELGRPIIKLVPTIYIVDSLPLLVPNSVVDESGELSGNMAAAMAARVNAGIFRRIIQQIGRANILLFVINHITKKIEINPFIRTQAQINYMSQDEQLPGGETPIFLANNVFKFTASTKLKADEGFGMDGFYSKIKLLKSRTNKAGQEVNSVFLQEYGFNNELTLFNELKENGRLLGSPRSYYLSSAPDEKFTAKTFFKKYRDSEPLRRAVMNESIPILRKYIPSSSEEDGRGDKELLSDILTDINNDFDKGENYDDFIKKLRQR